jgi:hypothetical protein
MGGADAWRYRVRGQSPLLHGGHVAMPDAQRALRVWSRQHYREAAARSAESRGTVLAGDIGQGSCDAGKGASATRLPFLSLHHVCHSGGRGVGGAAHGRRCAGGEHV